MTRHRAVVVANTTADLPGPGEGLIVQRAGDDVLVIIDAATGEEVARVRGALSKFLRSSP